MKLKRISDPGERSGDFTVAGVAALAVAQFTISFQAVKAANSNPADSLRFE